MKITSIKVQVRDKNRVNVSVDGVYRFSLDMYQVIDLGIRIGKEYTEDELQSLLDESAYGKLYGRALEYTMMRPHSEKEVRDYLWRKTRATRTKDGLEKPGVSQAIADRVLERLKEKAYIDDQKFTKYWVENRSLIKGTSVRKLKLELRTKGVDTSTIDEALAGTERLEADELQKVIAKKRSRYIDDQKFITYLIGQGFNYDDVKKALKQE